MCQITQRSTQLGSLGGSSAHMDTQTTHLSKGLSNGVTVSTRAGTSHGTRRAPEGGSLSDAKVDPERGIDEPKAMQPTREEALKQDQAPRPAAKTTAKWPFIRTWKGPGSPDTHTRKHTVVASPCA